jgi:hypothetical protein
MTKTSAKRIFRPVLVGAASALLAAPAFAHHSFAMYDQSQTKTFTGKLTRFIPGANHAQIYFNVVDDQGKPRTGDDGKPLVWGIEMGPAAVIAKQGVTVKDFPTGTVVTVTLNPLRDGRPFGAIASGAVVIKCGAAIPQGGCNKDTGKVFLESRN